MFRRTLGALAVGTAVVALGAADANAAGFFSRSQSVVGVGSAWAGMAAPGVGLSGMYWNPAVVTSLPGRNSEWNLMVVIPDAHMNVTSNSAVVRGPTGVVIPAPFDGGLTAATLAAQTARGNGPEFGTTLATSASYANFQLNPDVFIGLSINAPWGNGTHQTRAWAGNWDGTRSRLFTVNVQPVIGYRVNNNLSIAIGAQIQYLRVTLEQMMGPAPLPFSALNFARAQLTGNAWGLGFTIGATYDFGQGTSIGIGYRSAVRHRLDGSQTLDAAAGAVAAGSYPISLSITLPDMVHVGLRHRFNDEFMVSIGAEWRNWSRIGTFPVSGSPTGAVLPFNFKDAWFVSAGVEWRAMPQLTLRAGIGYDWSPVQDAWRTPGLPDNDRIVLSLGATYDVNRQLSISAGYSFLMMADAALRRSRAFPLGAPFPAGSTLTVGYEATAETHIHVIGLSARVRWDDPPPAVEPVVAKF